jgi:hypothetical protein
MSGKRLSNIRPIAGLALRVTAKMPARCRHYNRRYSDRVYREIPSSDSPFGFTIGPITRDGGICAGISPDRGFRENANLLIGLPFGLAIG